MLSAYRKMNIGGYSYNCRADAKTVWNFSHFSYNFPSFRSLMNSPIESVTTISHSSIFCPFLILFSSLPLPLTRLQFEVRLCPPTLYIISYAIIAKIQWPALSFRKDRACTVGFDADFSPL